jgi:succinate dehydrogenase / fumarate reductase, iron-sulfur subunit
MMKVTLEVWRQENAKAPGTWQTFDNVDVSPDQSFLEMLDEVNDGLISKGERPIAFDHDCREGICGACGVMINGEAHGPRPATTTCQLHMREFKSGDRIAIEPFRAGAFPIIQDLVVDRGAFDRIIQSGGFISANTGSAPDANNTPIRKADSDTAFDAAACIGCGACVASCPNASAMLFTSAKITHLGLLPQGQPERNERVQRMVIQMDQEGFGGCTSHAECEASCPKEIPVQFIARMNRDYIQAAIANPLSD